MLAQLGVSSRLISLTDHTHKWKPGYISTVGPEYGPWNIMINWICESCTAAIDTKSIYIIAAPKEGTNIEHGNIPSGGAEVR